MKVTFYLSYEEIMNIAKEHFSKTHNIPLEDVEVRYKVSNDVCKNDIINIETEEDRNKVVSHMKNLINDDGYLEAVKYVRVATGCGLREAIHFAKNEELWEDFIINNNIL